MATQLIAGVLEHLDCYLRTGSLRAAHRALLLLQRVVLEEDRDELVRSSGDELSETLEVALGRQAGRPLHGEWVA